MMLGHLPPTVAVAPLVTWMLILTVKHVVGDFIFQTSWMANGKDARNGWLLPLLAHCAVHGVLATVIFAILVPHLWFLGLVDFVVHTAIDRAKGFCVSHFDVRRNNDQWFWWLIGIDQAVHHFWDFGLALYVVAVP